MTQKFSEIDALVIYHNEILPQLDIDNFDKEIAINEMVVAVNNFVEVHPEYKDVALYIMGVTSKMVTNHKPHKTLNAFITLLNQSDLKHHDPSL